MICHFECSRCVRTPYVIPSAAWESRGNETNQTNHTRIHTYARYSLIILLLEINRVKHFLRLLRKIFQKSAKNHVFSGVIQKNNFLCNQKKPCFSRGKVQSWTAFEQFRPLRFALRFSSVPAKILRAVAAPTKTAKTHLPLEKHRFLRFFAFRLQRFRAVYPWKNIVFCHFSKKNTCQIAISVIKW